MIARRVFFIGLAAILLLAGKPAVASDFSTDARSLITSLGNKMIDELTGQGLTRAEREDRFRVILHDHFAVGAIGRWVLGRHWRKATDAERAEYLPLFEDLVIASYVNRFEKYTNQTLTVNEARMGGSEDVIVFSQLNKANGRLPLKVAWRVWRVKPTGELKVIDIIVEGVSMIQTQRSEFSSAIRESGGEIRAFLDKLRRQIKKAA